MLEYNIRTKDLRLMLGDWVDFDTAQEYLAYYKKRYPPGKPYPNGKGRYPDSEFKIVARRV